MAEQGRSLPMWSSMGEVVGVECTVKMMLSSSALACTEQSTKTHRSALRTNARTHHVTTSLKERIEGGA
jgi:hypothetical protein